MQHSTVRFSESHPTTKPSSTQHNDTATITFSPTKSQSTNTTGITTTANVRLTISQILCGQHERRAAHSNQSKQCQSTKHRFGTRSTHVGQFEPCQSERNHQSEFDVTVQYIERLPDDQSTAGRFSGQLYGNGRIQSRTIARSNGRHEYAKSISGPSPTEFDVFNVRPIHTIEWNYAQIGSVEISK